MSQPLISLTPAGSPEDREHRSHPRDFGHNRYVYAVLSRRSGGISVGINLNPDKRCNFDCIYCQVDRADMPQPEAVDLERLCAELRRMLATVADGSLAAQPRFADLPIYLKRLKDVALSGDGEPTECPMFAEVVNGVLEVIADSGLGPVPVVLITNGSGLGRMGVREGVDRLMAEGGRVWAKLDAGTPEFFQRVCSTSVPFDRVLKNIAATAQRWPITLQTCWFALDGNAPDDGEVSAYTERVADIIASGGTVSDIQLYTVARAPAQGIVSALSREQLDTVAAPLREALATTRVTVYP